MNMSIQAADGQSALGVGHDVDVNGVTGTVERIDPDGKVTVALATGPTVSGYPAGTSSKAWPPAGIETK